VLKAQDFMREYQPDAYGEVHKPALRESEAEAAARQVLARHPKDADAYRNLAAIEADRGHVRLAESALNNARKLDDKDAGILNSLGLLAMRRDDVAAARAYFEQAAQIDPGFAPAFANLGAVALSYRDYPAAERAYGKAVQLDATRWEAHLAHGWALEGLRKPKEARGEFEAALALKPGQEDALYGKALALKAENDLPAALQAFKEYAAGSKAAHLTEAKAQITSIELRLKNPPAQAAKPAGAPSARPAGSAAAELDLSKLPQGADSGPSNEKLPTEEGKGPGAAPDAPAKATDKPAGSEVPAAGKDGGVQNALPARGQAASR
jgi:Flp pilus assembly protein TadD